MPTPVAAVLGSSASRLLPGARPWQSFAGRRELNAIALAATRRQPGVLFRHGTARVAAGASVGNHWHVEETSALQEYEGFDDDDHDDADDETDEEGDEESPPPPLPATALELLSEVLTGIANSDTSGWIPSMPGLNQPAGALAAGYKPLQFCVNCCRPLPNSAAVCSGCGHDRARTAEVLGDPNAWVEAYAAQLRKQQQLEQQEQEQRQRSSYEATTAAAATAALPASQEVLLAADARTLLHRSSLPPYPGRPERLQAIMSRIHSRNLMARCRLLACRPAEDQELLGVHSRELVAAVRSMGAGSSAATAARGSQSEGDSSVSSGNGQRCGCSPAAVHEGGGVGRTASCEGAGGAAGDVQAAQATTTTDAATAASDTAAAGPTSTQPTGALRGSVLCADTLYNAHTCTAALLAAGAAIDLGAALAAGRARGALAVVRPPGAQAGFDVARGGCYLNNVALAASAALAEGVQRIMIVDWDVHHGRGTQEIFADDPRVMVVSMHRYDRDTYPGSGALEEVGEGAGEGSTINVAFGGPGIVDGDLLSAALHVVLPVAYQFRPQLVLVAAGFGALHGDPIGGCNCSPAVFAHLTHLLSGVAPRGVGLLLEGGYNLAATAEAVEGCLRVLLGEAPPPLPGPWGTTSAGWVTIMNTMQVHSQYWSALHPLSFNGWASAINNQQRQQQEQEQQHHHHHHHSSDPQHHRDQHDQQSASFGGTPGGASSWAAVSIGEDEDDVEGSGDGLGTDELAQLSAVLRQRREATDLVARDKSMTEAEGLVDVEQDDPRDIDPSELLDVFFGAGPGGGGDAGGGGSSDPRVAMWEGLAEGEEAGAGGDEAKGSVARAPKQ